MIKVHLLTPLGHHESHGDGLALGQLESPTTALVQGGRWADRKGRVVEVALKQAIWSRIYVMGLPFVCRRYQSQPFMTRDWSRVTF